ncbi:hypothetical protein DL96DRAFT_1556785 [Flagelloscypha sp. PMI_526]|nr:hypothetical protein DL96DRAFT_1556785 [Flagelloscypha sp. PMI_526]
MPIPKLWYTLTLGCRKHSRSAPEIGPFEYSLTYAIVEGEVENANEALRTWLGMDSLGFPDPLNAPDFPFPEFVYTCFVKSGPMKNRKRIWEMIKQVETLLANGHVDGSDWDSKQSESEA